MNASQRRHEIEMMIRRLHSPPFSVKVVLEPDLCLNINGAHLHQKSVQDLHSFLSGYLAACEYILVQVFPKKEKKQ